MLDRKGIDDQTVSLLKQAKKEEVLSILRLIDKSATEKDIKKETPQRIVNSLFASGYLKSLTQVADKLGVLYIPVQYEVTYEKLSIKTIADLEEKIFKKILKLSYENMSDVEKSKFDKKVKDIATKHGYSGKGIMGAAGLMTVANLGGFTTYMLMSSFLSVVSFGTLGFGAYTAASSILSTIIGPVGWAALGLFAVYKLSKPKYKELIPGIIIVGLIRQRIEYEKEQARRAATNKEKVTTANGVGGDDIKFALTCLIIFIVIIFLLWL